MIDNSIPSFDTRAAMISYPEDDPPLAKWGQPLDIIINVDLNRAQSFASAAETWGGTALAL